MIFKTALILFFSLATNAIAATATRTFYGYDADPTMENAFPLDDIAFGSYSAPNSFFVDGKFLIDQDHSGNIYLNTNIAYSSAGQLFAVLPILLSITHMPNESEPFTYRAAGNANYVVANQTCQISVKFRIEAWDSGVSVFDYAPSELPTDECPSDTATLNYRWLAHPNGYQIP